MQLKLKSIITTVVLTLALTGMNLEAKVNILIGSNKNNKTSTEEQPSDRRLSKPARERKVQKFDEEKTAPPSPSDPGTPISPEPLPPSAPSAIPASTADSSSVSEPTPSTDRRIVVRDWERELYKQQQAKNKADSENSNKSPNVVPPATQSADKPIDNKNNKKLSSQIDIVDSLQKVKLDSSSKKPIIITNPHRRF